MDLDSDAAEEAALQDSASDHSDQEAASDAESGSEISDAGPKGKGRGKKTAAPARSAKSKAAPRSTPSAAKPRAAAAKKASATVVNLDEDEEYDSDHRQGTTARGISKATSSAASAAASKKTNNAAIDLDNDDIVDEDGFMQSGAPAGSSNRAGALSTQISSMRLPGGTAGRKRQLPLSFSQSAPSQGAAARKGNTNKSLASGWDD